MECPYETCPLKVHYAEEVEEVEILWESQVVNNFKETTSSWHKNEDAHMNSWTMWQQAQGCHKLKKTKISAEGRGSGHKIPLVAKSLFVNSSYQESEVPVFFYGVTMGILTTLQGRSHAQSFCILTNTNLLPYFFDVFFWERQWNKMGKEGV